MHLIAERREDACDSQASRAGTDEGDLLTIGCKRSLRHQRERVISEISCDPFQTTDRDRFLVDAAAPACRFAWAVAGTAENPGEYIRVPVDHVCLGVAALGDQA